MFLDVLKQIIMNDWKNHYICYECIICINNKNIIIFFINIEYSVLELIEIILESVISN